MSNIVVGDVYSRIVNEVIDSSRVDFEENGVDPVTLEELKTVWQRKLSSLKVAQFPWDPAPISDAQAALQMAQNAAAAKGMPPQMVKKEAIPNMQQPGMQGVRIKQEPGSEPSVSINPEIAAIRAAQNIQQRFPNQQLPQGMQDAAARMNGARPTGLMLPGTMPPQRNGNMQQNPTNMPNSIPQTDGAGEDGGIPVEGWGTLSRAEADNIILTKIAQKNEAVQLANEELAQALGSLSKKKSSRSSKIPRQQVDGGDEDDEDAINSDLDDPDDELLDNEDDDEIPQIMLCMYDKVTRTKNKWKCVLKDGVLTVNGKEYVFHKANGEYEW